MNMIMFVLILAAIVPLVPGQNSCQSLADNLFNGNCKSFVRPCPLAVTSPHHFHAPHEEMWHLLCCAQSFEALPYELKLDPKHGPPCLTGMQVGYFKDKADYAISQSDAAFKNTAAGAPYPSDS